MKRRSLCMQAYITNPIGAGHEKVDMIFTFLTIFTFFNAIQE